MAIDENVGAQPAQGQVAPEQTAQGQVPNDISAQLAAGTEYREPQPKESDPVYGSLQLATAVPTTPNYFSQRSSPFIVGTPENQQLLNDARTSDKITPINIRRAIKQRERYIARENANRTNNSNVFPEGQLGSFVGNVEPIEDGARVLTSLGTTEDEIQTNLYYEQERTDEEADFYFNLVRPRLHALQDRGVNLATLSIGEMSQLIRDSGGLKDDKDFARFSSSSWNTPGAVKLGVSAYDKFRRKMVQLDPDYARGEHVDNMFMSGRFTWDHTNESQRELFKAWGKYKTSKETDWMSGLYKGASGVAAMYVDLAAGIINGTVAPEQYISEEWLADPVKKKEVIDTLSGLTQISSTARQVLGLSDNRSVTEQVMGVERANNDLLFDPDDITSEILTGPENAARLAKVKELIDKGALKGSRWRVITSLLDGFGQGTSGLFLLPMGAGLNPEGSFNSVITNMMTAVKDTEASFGGLFSIPVGDWESNKLTNQMKWANLSRDMSATQTDWMANGMWFNDPSTYSKLGGGAGGQAIDFTVGAGVALRAAKSARYGFTAAARLEHAAASAERIAELGKKGMSLAEMTAAARAAGGDESYLAHVVRVVQEEAAAAGEAISEAEAAQRVLSGKISFKGIPMTAKELDEFAVAVENWTSDINKAMSDIDVVVNEARKTMPDGINMTNEQIMEYLANNSLPQGAGKAIYNVYDSLDNRAKLWFVNKLRQAGPTGEKLLEQLRLTLPDKEALFGLQRGMAITGKFAGVGIAGYIAGSSLGIGGLTAVGIAAALNWRYLLPDALIATGYVGDKLALMDDYWRLSSTGETLYGSVWLKLYKEKLKEAAEASAKAVSLEMFPKEAAVWRQKAADAAERARGAKNMHAWWGPNSTPSALTTTMGEMATSGMIMDMALTWVNQDMYGMGYGGTLGNAVWNKGYNTLWSRGVLKNNDQLFAKQMIELREIYSRKDDSQRGALIRVLERVQKDGTLRETVSGLVRAHAQGVDVTLMNEHQASAVVRAFHDGIPGPDGRLDVGKMIVHLQKYGLTAAEADAYVSTLAKNDQNRGVLLSGVSSLRTKADELGSKANVKAQALIVRTEKLNGATVAMNESKVALLAIQEEAKLVQAESNTASASGMMTPDIEARLADVTGRLKLAQRDFDAKTGILRRTKDTVDSEMAAIAEMRKQSEEMHKQAEDLQAQVTPKDHYIGQQVVMNDGSVGRMINNGVFIFDKENGRRHIILNEASFTRADALEEVFHAMENDAVVQELRPQAVTMLFGKFGRDAKTGEVVQLEPGVFDKADADNFMHIYAQGLPNPELAAAFIQRYEIAYEHYKNTGNPEFLYSQVSEIMARQFVGREVSLGLYSFRGQGTPSTPYGGAEGSVNTAAGSSKTGKAANAFFRMFAGDANLRDYVDAGFTKYAEAFGLLGKNGLFDKAFNMQKLDYLKRSGVEVFQLKDGTWQAGYLFDENGNRIKDPVFDSYIDDFNAHMRGSSGQTGTLRRYTMDEVYKMTPSDQVAWATANNRRHWLNDKGVVKPIAQIVSEGNRVMDSVFIEVEKRAKAGEVGLSLSVDQAGVERIVLSPRAANEGILNKIIEESDIPVNLKRQAIQIIAGIAGGDVLNPNALHPGMLPGYAMSYNPVTSKGMPDPYQRQQRKFIPYSISIERTKVGVKGERLEQASTNMYFNVIDAEQMAERPYQLLRMQLTDEENVPFFTRAQVEAMFPGGTPDIMRHFQLYLSNMSGAVTPELIAAARKKGKYDPPARSWELFDISNGSDPVAVANAKIIAEMMYRMLGTRPTKKMQGLAPGTKKDIAKAEKLEENAEDLSDDPFERITMQDGGSDQPGLFRKIRLDRIESVVNLKAPFGTGDSLFPFSSKTYELSQIAHGVKLEWRQINQWSDETSSAGAKWWSEGTNKAFRQKYEGKILQGYVHPNGYLVYKTSTSKHWFTANLKSGEVLSQGELTPTDAFASVARHAMETVQKPVNGIEQQMVAAGFFPRGLADRANGFRSVYQSRDGLILERKGLSGSRRFEMKDRFGNVVSSNILISVNADVIDPGQLTAAARIGRQNGRIILGLQQQLPGMPGNFPHFYNITDPVSGAQMKGVVGGKNPKYHQIRSVLLETLGPKNAEMVLGTMIQELGYEVVHSDQQAVFNWTSNFFTKRVNEDMRNRLKSNFPQEDPNLPDWSRATGLMLFTLEEANLYSGSGPRPNRAVLLSRADPIRLKVYEGRVESERLAAQQAVELADQIRQKGIDAQARMDEWNKNVRAREKALDKARKSQNIADTLEAEALSKRNEFLKLLDEQDESTKNELIARLQSLLEQEGSGDWKGQDTIYQEAVAAVKGIKRDKKQQAAAAKASTKKFSQMEELERRDALLAEAQERKAIADHYEMLANKQKEEIQAAAKAEEQRLKDLEAQERERERTQKQDLRDATALRRQDEKFQAERKKREQAERLYRERIAEAQAKHVLKDGVLSSLISQAGESAVDFDTAMTSVQQSLADLRKQLQEQPTSSPLEMTALNRASVGVELNKALHKLRETEQATINNIIGNEFGWKIAEITISETQPKTAASRIGQAAWAAVTQRGFSLDLTPGMQEAGATGNRPLLGLAPDAPTGQLIVQAAMGTVANIPSDVSRILRRKYVLYNASNMVVGIYQSQEEAAEAAAKEHVTSKKR